MGILSDKGITDDQIKGFFATNPTADQVAQQAASLGLSKDQLSGAMGVGNYGGTTAAERDANINNYTSQPNSNYSFNGNGILAQARAPAAAPAANSGDGMQIGNTYYGKADLQKFFAEGGDPNQWAQQHGITDQDQIHQLATKARGIAGNAPTGDAALQAAWQNYKKYNPNGAGVNDYAGFVANLGNRGDAIRAGTYTGAFNDASDYAPGGIYYGRNISYQQAGLGSRGDGSAVEGDAWANGAAGTPGASGGGSGAVGGSGGIIDSVRGGTSGGSSSAYGGSGPGNWQVDTPQTVAGQFDKLTNGDNVLMQKARTGALERMADRGLVNSSMATTAADSAAYDAALQIAKPDAATFADAAKTNANAQTSWGIAQNNNSTSKDINAANISAQRELTHANQLYQNLANQTASANSIQSWGVNMITTIQTSPELSAEAKTAAIDSVKQYLGDSYQIQGDWHTSAARAIDAIFK